LSGADEASPLKEEVAAAAAELEVQNRGPNAREEAGAYKGGGTRLAQRASLAANFDAPRQGSQSGAVGFREGLDERFVIHRKVGPLVL
jgi:hypothetical protein